METPRSSQTNRSLSPRTKDTDEQVGGTPSRSLHPHPSNSSTSSSLSPAYKSLSTVTGSSTASILKSKKSHHNNHNHPEEDNDHNNNTDEKHGNDTKGATGLAHHRSGSRSGKGNIPPATPTTTASNNNQSTTPGVSPLPDNTINNDSTAPSNENKETDDQRIDRVRRLLDYRQENSRYFDTARRLGPQVFTDTVPLLFNSLLIIIFGNIVVNNPSIGMPKPSSSTSTSLVASSSTFEYNDVPGACGTVPTLRIYVQGLIIAAYIFCGIMGWYTLRTQVTTHIRWPFLLISLWCGGIGAWTFFGIGAVTQGVLADCIRTSPFLFGLAVTELVLCPLLAGSIILKWFASAMWLNTVAFIAWCQKSFRRWQEKRSRYQSTVT